LLLNSTVCGEHADDTECHPQDLASKLI
jgi:hypothetical protein